MIGKIVGPGEIEFKLEIVTGVSWVWNEHVFESLLYLVPWHQKLLAVQSCWHAVISVTFGIGAEGSNVVNVPFGDEAQKQFVVVVFVAVHGCTIEDVPIHLAEWADGSLFVTSLFTFVAQYALHEVFTVFPVVAKIESVNGSFTDMQYRRHVETHRIQKRYKHRLFCKLHVFMFNK